MFKWMMGLWLTRLMEFGSVGWDGAFYEIYDQ